MLNNIAALTNSGVAAVGDYQSIATTTLSSSQATITFSSIPSTYKHLQLRAIARSGRTTQNDDVYLNINSDTGSNYAYHYLLGDGATASAGALATQTKGYVARNTMAGASSAANVFSPFIVDILDYTSTNKNKTIRTLGGTEENSNNGGIALISSLYFATPAAITTLTLTLPSSASFVTYSSFALYGIK